MRRAQRQTLYSVLILIVVAAAIGGAIFLINAMQPEEVDPETLCALEGRPPAHTVVLIDKTDGYSCEQAGSIHKVVERTSEDLARGERISVSELDESGRYGRTSQRALSLCSPGSGRDANPLFNNPQQMRERYEELFGGPLDQALANLAAPRSPAPRSPILEAVVRLAQTESFNADQPGRKIVIVSDMLQYSDAGRVDLFNVYPRSRFSVDALPDPYDVAETALDEFGADLTGVDVEVRLIPRVGWEDVQRSTLRDYWEDVFTELGASSVAFRDLPEPNAEDIATIQGCQG